MTAVARPGAVRARRTVSWLDDCRWTLATIAMSVAFLGGFGRIGGDWDWMVALGDHARATGEVPDFVPFATADSSGWHNVPVLAELMSSFVHDLGGRAVLPVHLALVALTLSVLAATVRTRGTGDARAAAVVAVVVLGVLPTLAIVRAQTYSLALFALLLALVSDQARRPDHRIWWVVPLVAVWANLHGAALLGVCVLGAYLLIGRLRERPAESVGVGVSSLLAVCVTPQLWRTPAYYASVFDNVSAQRAEGLWARPDLGEPVDLLMVLAAGALLVPVLRARREAWEYVAVLGLCLATASAARHGVWLLLLLAVVGAGRRDRDDDATAWRPAAERTRDVAILTAVASIVAVPVALARGDHVLGAAPELVSVVSDVAAGGVVLAPAPLSEALAVSGVRLWAGNPLDAFTHADQADYLDFLDGTRAAPTVLAEVDVVVALDGSAQASLLAREAGFAARPCTAEWICFTRR